MTAEPIRIVSLFAGAGGIDTGVAQACEAAGLELLLDEDETPLTAYTNGGDPA